jgi:hypothetical protein
MLFKEKIWTCLNNYKYTKRTSERLLNSFSCRTYLYLQGDLLFIWFRLVRWIIQRILFFQQSQHLVEKKTHDVLSWSQSSQFSIKKGWHCLDC